MLNPKPKTNPGMLPQSPAIRVGDTALHGFTQFLVIFREKHPAQTKEAFCNTASISRA
jgi:hypothetical protein